MTGLASVYFATKTPVLKMMGAMRGIGEQLTLAINTQMNMAITMNACIYITHMR